MWTIRVILYSVLVKADVEVATNVHIILILWDYTLFWIVIVMAFRHEIEVWLTDSTGGANPVSIMRLTGLWYFNSVPVPPNSFVSRSFFGIISLHVVDTIFSLPTSEELSYRSRGRKDPWTLPDLNIRRMWKHNDPKFFIAASWEWPLSKSLLHIYESLSSLLKCTSLPDCCCTTSFKCSWLSRERICIESYAKANQQRSTFRIRVKRKSSLANTNSSWQWEHHNALWIFSSRWNDRCIQEMIWHHSITFHPSLEE